MLLWWENSYDVNGKRIFFRLVEWELGRVRVRFYVGKVYISVNDCIWDYLGNDKNCLRVRINCFMYKYDVKCVYVWGGFLRKVWKIFWCFE